MPAEEAAGRPPARRRARSPPSPTACGRSTASCAPASAGRAIVDEATRRQAEIVVLGAPRGRHKAIFGKTVDYVLKNAPCRVMVAAGKKAA